MEIEINNQIHEILNDEIETTVLDEEFDIPLYQSQGKRGHKKILVLSGGGIKGIAHIGVFSALEELNILDKIDTFAGASVGSILIALYVVGYSAQDLKEFITKFDLGQLRYLNIFNFLKTFGLDSGLRIEYFLRRLINAKGYDPEITLADLYEKTGKKIIFTSTCLNNKEVCYLSHDTYPNLPLYLAVRMSISVPWFYTPVYYEGRLYIDGGCIDNYPIQLFADRLNEVLGVYLVETKDEIEEIQDIETYTLRVLSCFMDGVTFNSKKGYEKYTIDVHMESINIVAYGVDKEKKDEMLKVGYDSVISWAKAIGYLVST